MRRLAPILVLGFVASGALAETLPQRGVHDARIRTVLWRPDDVVRIETALRHITAIEFGRGEMIRAILAGDSESFELVRLKSGETLSVKPKVPGAVTNLVVYTSRRAYAFDLRTIACTPPARIRFTYPEEEPARRPKHPGALGRVSPARPTIRRRARRISAPSPPGTTGRTPISASRPMRGARRSSAPRRGARSLPSTPPRSIRPSSR